MSDDEAEVDAARFRPHAAQPMAEMFDDVSGRYDFLNTLLSMGQDRAWRRAMWREVPTRARAVLDLCTGSGVSLPGLRRPGRLVIGVDVSLRMLERAAESQEPAGWAPRLVCADAFQLPLESASLDAVTIAFGARNLRPLADALAELARVLAPGGALVVLEAAAPARGPFAPFHRFYLERIVPAAGRLSDDPSAYGYLARSILDFGSGPEFESALVAAGFSIERRRSFLFGATRLWVGRRAGEPGQIAAVSPSGMQAATRRGAGQSAAAFSFDAEWRAWTVVQAALSAGLLAALLYAGWVVAKSGASLPLPGWSRGAAWTLIVVGSVAFGLRTLALVMRLLSGPPRS